MARNPLRAPAGLIHLLRGLVFALGVGACAGPETLVVDSCPEPGGLEPVTCGWLEVPENRGEPDGRRIRLRVMVLRADREGPATDALFVLTGGPGQAATEQASMFAAEHAEVRASRDIVLVDQRGTGGSRPLRCDPPDPEAPAAELRRSATRCLERYRDVADVRWYTTPHAADDIEAVRRALGYERIDLDAGSYGTRVALVYLRRHPDRVRSAVLRGVSPTEYRSPLPFPRAGQVSMERLFAACAVQSACDSAFPSLSAKLEAVIRRLEASPVSVQVATGGDSTRTITIGRDRFASQLHLLLFFPELAVRIPFLVDRAHEEDFDAFAELAAAIDRAVEEQIYWGLQLAVVCPEDVARISEADIAREASGTFLGDGQIRDYQEICGAWPAAPLPDDYWEPTISDVPTLIVSGEVDPSTPPRFGEEAARHLSRSRHIVISGGTHVHRSPCLDRVVRDFLLAGDHAAVDPSCLENEAPVPFYLGEEAEP